MLAVRVTVFCCPPLVALQDRVVVAPRCGTRKMKPTSASNFGLKISTAPVGCLPDLSQTMCVVLQLAVVRLSKPLNDSSADTSVYRACRLSPWPWTPVRRSTRWSSVTV